MSKKNPVPFLGPTYQSNYLAADAQRCVNWFKKGDVLLPTPGMQQIVEVGSGPIRGMITHKDHLLVVSHGTVFKVSSGFYPLQVGVLDTTESDVWMSSSGYDGEQVLITDGSYGYIWDGSTVTKITDPEFPINPRHNVFTDGYFVVMEGDSGRIHKAADAFEAASWDGEQATAEANPDRLRAIIANRNDLWLIGEKSLETWYYSGATFPWDPNRSAFQMYGIQAPNSLVRVDNNLAWIAQSEELTHTAVLTNGYAMTRISTTAIEKEWKGYANVEDCRAFTYKMPGLGHFVVFQFIEENRSWVYDVEEKQWHEWEEYAINPLAVRRHRGDFYASFGGKHVVAENSWLYELSDELYTDNGSEIVRKRMGPNIITNTHNMVFNEMELVMTKGTGGATHPVVRMNYSDDRGVSWSNFQTASFGASGGRTVRTRFFRLGSSRERMFNLEISDAAHCALMSVVLDVGIGMH